MKLSGRLLVFGMLLLPFELPAQCQVRNVILVIGDGMGLAEVAYLAYSQDQPITLERFPVIGLQKTYSASALITDSGAAATAMSCGVKTYNNAVGVNVDSLPCESLFERAHKAGKKTGVVVTSSLVHATPAAFLGHQRLRGFQEAIAADIVQSKVDYCVGGGLMYFTNRYSDDRNLIKEMEADGYFVGTYENRSFRNFSSKSEPRMAYFTAYSEPLPLMQGREPLKEPVEHALAVLTEQAENGYILMIEASQIDFALHGQEATYLLSELRDLDEALEVLYRYVSGRNDTLLIVTGDHETSSLTLTESVPGKKVHVEFLTKNHSHVMVPVYAAGACAEEFAGIYENTAIHDKILKVTGM